MLFCSRKTGIKAFWYTNNNKFALPVCEVGGVSRPEGASNDACDGAGGVAEFPRDKQSQLGFGLGSAPNRRDSVNPSPSSSVSISVSSSPPTTPYCALEGGEGKSSLGWGGGGNPPEIGGSPPLVPSLLLLLDGSRGCEFESGDCAHEGEVVDVGVVEVLLV